MFPSLGWFKFKRRKPIDVMQLISSLKKCLLIAVLPLALGACTRMSEWLAQEQEPQTSKKVMELREADVPACGVLAPKEAASASPAKSLEQADAPKGWPSHLATYHYSLGVLHGLEENNVEAIREFETALKYDPASPQIATELATAYAEKGDTQKAVALCERVLSENPDSVDLNMILAGLYMNAREYKLAAVRYRRVLAVGTEERQCQPLSRYG